MLYRSIPGLRDYVLVESESVLVEHYQRIATHEWHLHEYQQQSDGFHLKSIDQRLEIARFYEGVELI